MVRIQEKISQGLEVLQYFTMRPWCFPSENYDYIQGRLNDEEQVIYNTDVTNFNRNEYLHTCIEGGRIFRLKEDPNRNTINKSYHNL